MSSSSLINSMSGTGSSSAGSGLDVGATVDQLIYTEQAPERLLQKQQASLWRRPALCAISTADWKLSRAV